MWRNGLRNTSRAGRARGRRALRIGGAIGTTALLASTVLGGGMASAAGRSGAAADDWGQAGRDAGHSATSPSPLVDVGSVGLRHGWAAAAVDPADTLPPVVVAGVVYVPASGGVSALNAATGHRLWHTTTGPVVNTELAAGGGRVFDVSRRGGADFLDALAAGTGRHLYSVRLDTTGGSGSPMLANGLVYLSTAGGTLLQARDQATGRLVWKRPVAGTASDPAVAGGRLVATTANGATMLALDALTGAVRWRTALPAAGSYSRWPSLVRGVAYTESAAGVVAVSAASGALLWTAPQTAPGYTGSLAPLVVDGARVMTQGGWYSRTVWIMAAATGAVLSTAGFDYPYPGALMAADNGVLFVTSSTAENENSTAAIDERTGNEIASDEWAGASDGVSVSNGQLYCMSGQAVWAYRLTPR